MKKAHRDKLSLFKGQGTLRRNHHIFL